MLVSLLISLSARGRAESPDDVLARLCTADQAESGAPLPDSTRAARRSQRIRQARALLARGEFQDPRSYDHAALLFQHGNRTDDFLVARELAMLAGFRRAVVNGLPALAEDRYLVSLGLPMRFGG
ncbi:MAG: hypothetical protein HGA66_09150, partial [Holophaga sp.]|nr:hypothetical protein [Holophaga sp.]